MKHLKLILLLLVTTQMNFISFGQDKLKEWEDSIKSTISLDEITVKASRKSMRGDTLSVIPTNDQRKMSLSGYELLRSIMLPGIRVDAVNGTVQTSDGRQTVILVDGRPVEKLDLLALRPKDVARVEYLQNPGAEYGYDTSKGAVINIIMKQRNDGYAIGVMTSNAVTTAKGNNFVYGKYNFGDSELNLSFNEAYTSLTDRTLNQENRYLLDENKWHNYNTHGDDQPIKNFGYSLQLGYNYYKPKKVIFDVKFNGSLINNPDRRQVQKVSETGQNDFYQLTMPLFKNISPSLNIYYKRFLNSKSSITANLVGVYQKTTYNFLMSESSSYNFASPFSSYSYDSDGSRQAYIGEVKYTNRFIRQIGLNTGMRVSHTYTNNKYTGDNNFNDKAHETNIYAFASAYGYLFNNRLYYLLGAGASGRIHNQNGINNSKWVFRPNLQLIYYLKNWRFTFSGQILQNSPGLNQMADTEIQGSRFESTKGNPDLHDWWSYSTAFWINGNIGPVWIQNYLSYNNSQNPVLPTIYRRYENGFPRFITTYENHHSTSVIYENFSANVNLFKCLNLSAGVSFTSYKSRGNNFSHDLNTWSYYASLDWIYKNWNAGFSWQSKNKSLSGESLSYNGASNNLYINYLVGQFRFGVTAVNLFQKNGETDKTIMDNRYMYKSESVKIPAHGNMIMISVAWNFSKGKQHKRVNIDMNNTDTESGIIQM